MDAHESEQWQDVLPFASVFASEASRTVLSTLTAEEIGVLNTVQARLREVVPDVEAHMGVGSTFW
jgi:hypothetical protein